MAQKVNPVAVRLYLNRYFNSSWFSDYYYTQLLSQDYFLRNYLKKICGIKNKSLNSQNASHWRFGQCTIHRYSKKIIVHLFYLLPNYRSFGNNAQQVSKLLPLQTADWLESRESYKFPVRNIASLVSQVAHFDTVPSNLVDNLGFNGSKMPNLYLFPSHKNLKCDYFSINIPTPCLPGIVLLMNTTSIFQLQNLNSGLDVPLQKQNWHRNDLALNDGANRRHFSALIQSWINFNWFILRYLFLQKYLINTCCFTRCAPLINFVNLFRKKFEVSVASQSLIGFVPAASRLSALSGEALFQSNKIKTIYISARKPHYTENTLTKKLSLENASTSYYCEDTVRFLSRCVPTATTRTKLLLGGPSNYVKIIPVRSTSIFQSASLLAEEICLQLIQKQSFVKIWKNIFRSLNRKKPPSIKGVRISCSGRLNGAEIAKKENRQWGETSLHVFQNKIDYAMQHALSPYGILGIKVWISYSE